MSLLLEVIRQLLEYLGIPPDRLAPIWERYIGRRSILRALANHLPPVFFQGIDIQDLQLLERKDYGWTRSVVRIIGTLLPLEPCPRPHFQRILGSKVLQPRDNEMVCRPDIPSLADAPFLVDDDVASYPRLRHLSSNMSVGEYTMARPSEENPGMTMIIQSSHALENVSLTSSEHAIQKIAALEDELMQLRAQIAVIVAMQETRSTPCSEALSFGSPCHALLPPSLTSTPINAQILLSTPAPPPPPPPPPPPIQPAKINSAKSAIDLIKERKAAHRQSPKEVDAAEKDTLQVMPSMMDVLKGMNSIRLRAVERSPGGTPLTKKDKKRRSLNDPAAIIAHALKQKFAHRHKNDSFDKENISHEESPFSSPETPMFGRHLLKPNGQRAMKEIPRKPAFN
ncbi:mitochondrial fission regulator 2 isoform X2 [Rana temporaria]|uniref:mitochondrial fission regulator 2 isoform X2 n=1 Tax=Rana temporaria TaxID=8407 RepID=UPI001AADEEED|nr:mitochondrial fission regulator 2 isoform X2 [Rana temporaria]